MDSSYSVPFRNVGADRVSTGGVEVVAQPDMVSKPPHYTQIKLAECSEVIEALGLDKHFHLAASFKYLWRHDSKGDKLTNIKKAVWYLERFVKFYGEHVGEVKSLIPDYDVVNSPKHYTVKGFECIDFIEALGLWKDSHVANAFKYIWRWDRKENPLENIKKAIWYLKRRITIIEAGV